ncbi:MAG: DeoR/GlpR family DNA-binding transcription regulator [Atopobium sp.]|uniref:DeoR/GlpR family DNA-binding transcription regulator n=1 Tax=Atopobium sp. TaxID=1872650 RepID=UPI002A74B3ED|nr:DeoR/GlpR family DNA-binding transcription regulator [Atopobium sp.]MDY2788998.1 DeoR/GlpR family DNA-binding transcription regulator [Atopobium sp.]MDY4522032.1 DeoR/GlpR family DNA-binding transcription regulator [Atopobium sp.]
MTTKNITVMDSTPATQSEDAIAGFVEARRARIMSLLNREGSVQVNQLAELFGVSRVTIRTDLDALGRNGRLRRTHGGALALTHTVTVSLQDQRVNLNAEGKRALAVAASQLVPNNTSILVDSGTTAVEFVKALAEKTGITLITNDFTIADLVDRSIPSIDVIVLGGKLRKGHRYSSGWLSLQMLESLHPDMAFVCPTAYAPQHGLTTNNQEMAELKRAFMHCAEKTCVLMDSSKLGAQGLIKFANLNDADLVVCEADSKTLLTEALEGSTTQLIVVPR